MMAWMSDQDPSAIDAPLACVSAAVLSSSASHRDGSQTIAVLASGSGTVLAALAGFGLPIAVVAVDRPCGAELVGARAGIPVERVVRRSFGDDFDREAYTAELTTALAPYDVSLVAMAGFGTILGPPIHRAFPGRILNTHPSLLPAFKGWHAVADAIAAGVETTGCTVHVATEELDSGPVLAQEEVKVLPGDTADTLHERIKAVERRLYPETIRRLLDEMSSRRRETACW
jgi:phosphoribosylglycinamide formyltransferase 1